MKAIVIEGGKGPAEALKLGERLTMEAVAGLQPGAGRRRGVRADIIQRLGYYPPPPGPRRPWVWKSPARWSKPRAAGKSVTGSAPCSAAAATRSSPPGDARHALPIPRGLSAVEAAGCRKRFSRLRQRVRGRRLEAGETLMVHGATSGIGVAAVQMGKAAGVKVIATARGNDKAAQALPLGADVAIDASTEDFAMSQRRPAASTWCSTSSGALLRREHGRAENRRADRLHRLPGRRDRGTADRRGDAEARDDHRLNSASAERRRKGAARRRGRARGLAVDRARRCGRSSTRPFRSPRPRKAHALLEKREHWERWC